MNNEIIKRLENLERENIVLREAISNFNRLFIKTDIPNLPPGDFESNTGFRREINLSGGAETITIPAYPTRFLELRSYQDFYIPLYSMSEIGL